MQTSASEIITVGFLSSLWESNEYTQMSLEDESAYDEGV